MHIQNIFAIFFLVSSFILNNAKKILIFDYNRKNKNFPQQILKIPDFVLYFAD